MAGIPSVAAVAVIEVDEPKNVESPSEIGSVPVAVMVESNLLVAPPLVDSEFDRFNNNDDCERNNLYSCCFICSSSTHNFKSSVDSSAESRQCNRGHTVARLNDSGISRAAGASETGGDASSEVVVSLENSDDIQIRL